MLSYYYVLQFYCLEPVFFPHRQAFKLFWLLMGENLMPYLFMVTSALLHLIGTIEEDLMLETDKMELDSICVVTTSILKSIIVCLVLQILTHQMAFMSFALMVSSYFLLLPYVCVSCELCFLSFFR